MTAQDHGDTLERPATLFDFEEQHPELAEPAPASVPELRGPEIKIKSRSSDRHYSVWPETPLCQCKGFQTAPADDKSCFHIEKARNLMLLAASEYFQTRYERELNSRFHSFKAFYEWLWQGKGNEEAAYLAKLFLALLYTQKSKRGTTDLIHLAVNEQFAGDPRKIGGVISRLKNAGLIVPCGYRVPSQRDICHKAPKDVYRITKKGMAMIGGIT
jgi:hypothetical protein